MTVNKLDRCFLELMLDGEEAFMGFRRTIESANVIMATYADELLGDTQVLRAHRLRTPGDAVALPQRPVDPEKPWVCSAWAGSYRCGPLPVHMWSPSG